MKTVKPQLSEAEKARRFSQAKATMMFNLGEYRRSYVAVGLAVKEIHDFRLWEVGYESFKAFLDSVGISPQSAHNLMRAAAVAEELAASKSFDAEQLKTINQSMMLVLDSAPREIWETILKAVAGSPSAKALKEAVKKAVEQGETDAEQGETDTEQGEVDVEQDDVEQHDVEQHDVEQHDAEQHDAEQDAPTVRDNATLVHLYRGTSPSPTTPNAAALDTAANRQVVADATEAARTYQLCQAVVVANTGRKVAVAVANFFAAKPKDQLQIQTVNAAFSRACSAALKELSQNPRGKLANAIRQAFALIETC